MRVHSTIIALLLLLLMTAAEAAAAPDAVVSRIAAEAVDIEAGQDVTIGVTVANAGSSSLPPVPVVLLVDDQPLAQWTAPAALGSGEHIEWTLTWKAERGSHILLAQVDPLNDVPEADERNNSAFLSLGVAEQPEPSPWPALLVGFVSLLLGILFGFLARRRRLRGSPVTRFERPSGPMVR